ncbi:energy transducer TonB [Pedobacter polaris]|nr:energy transducer TonB [Pedobacter polaris]
MKNIAFLALISTFILSSCQNEVKKDEQVKTDTTKFPTPVAADDSTAKDSVAPPPPVANEATAADDNTVYSFVSMKNPPKYPGGIAAFYKFLGQNIKYPADATAKNVQGPVFTSFIVEKDGSITDIKVDRKLGNGLDEEAIRVLKLAKKWIPGMQDGKPVRVKYSLPIKFTLAK